MKPTNEALKNYQLSDISYDKNANLAKATFTEDLTSNDKSSLKEIIVDIFGVKPGWIGHNGLTLNIPEKEFNNFQKLLVLDLQMRLADEEVTNEAGKGKKVNRNSFIPIGAMVKDFKESWNSKEMNREAKLVPGGEWVDVETGGDSDMMVCITPEMKKALPKDDGLFVMTVGDLMWDQDKKDFVTILTNNNGDEQAVWLQKGKGLEEIEKFMDANESAKPAPVVESFSSVLKGMVINEAKDADDNDIVDGDEVIVVGHTDQEGKKGTVVETSDSSDFVIVEIKGKNYSYHASDLRKVEEEEEEEEADFDTENTYEYVIDLDERGDFQAHIEDADGEVVYEISGMDDLMALIEDGFMKDKGDTDGLLKHLQDVGILDKYAILETLDIKIDKFLSKINEDMGDDDQLALDNSEPEYEVIVATEGPRDDQTAYKVAKKLEIPGSPDTGFIVSTKVLLRKFVNTLRGFDLAVSKILDGHNNEVALASIEAYKPKGRPTNKYNYPNRMREAAGEGKLVHQFIDDKIQIDLQKSTEIGRNLFKNMDQKLWDALEALPNFENIDIKKGIVTIQFSKVDDNVVTEFNKILDDFKLVGANEAFRDGQGSHFDSLLKGWAKENGVEYEMKFKDTRGKKNVPYFVLKLNFEQYDALPTEAKTALNGLMKKFGVDFSYKNRMWTPVIESVVNEEKLIKGEALTPEQKKLILAAFIYRNTKENEQNVRRFLKDKADAMKFEQSDEQWVKDHAFWFNNDGKALSGRKKHAEPAYLAD